MTVGYLINNNPQIREVIDLMYGVIDIGSNTMRLNIYKYENDEIYLMLSKKIMAGLAGYVNKEGYLTSKGIDKSIEYLLEFKSILDNIEVKETFAFATASLRNIENTEDATRLIEKKTGFDIQIISGEQEAILDYKGASIKLTLDEGLLIDIGGGSTELALYKNGEIQNAVSLPIGSLSLFNKHVEDFLPSKKEIKKIKKEVKNTIKKMDDLEIPINTKIICGVGGTVRATCKLKNDLFDLNLDNTEIQVKDIDKIIDYYLDNRYDFLTHIIKVIPDRLHTILPGMIILDTISKHYESESIVVSKYGIREGYLYQILNDEGYSHAQ